MTGKIYCISNIINDSKYVGKTVSSLEKRFQEHCRESRKERSEHRPLYSAMRKYGEDKFYIELIEEVPLAQLEEREIFWINSLNTYKEGYNATLGGDGKILYDYTLFSIDYLNGMLVKEIATKYGCDEHTVTEGLRCCGIDGNKNNIRNRSHPVQQFTLDGKFIRDFPSRNAAARQLISEGANGNVSSISTNIGRVISGKRKIANGFLWKEL